MTHRTTKWSKCKTFGTVLAFLSVFLAAGVAFAADAYWVVGGAGANYYFVPVAGQQFPNDHEGVLTVRDLAGADFNPQANAPMTLNPTTGTEAGNRLPAAGNSIAVTPTADQAKAGEARIRLTFNRDHTDPAGTAPRMFSTVDKWVVVGISFNRDPVTVGIGPNRTSQTPAYPATDPVTYPHCLKATVKPIAGKGHVSFDTTSAERATVQTGAFADDEQSNTSTTILTVTGVNATPSDSQNGDADVRGKVGNTVGKTIKVVVIKPDAVAAPHPTADSDVTPVNVCLNTGTSPAMLNVYDPDVLRCTNWSQWLTIQVNDQFGRALGSIYGGAPVAEVIAGNPANMNQNLTASGTYQDPVGCSRWITPLVLKTSQDALDWPTATKLTMANDDSQMQNIAVRVDGISLTTGIVNRTVEWTRPNHIKVTWPNP